MPDRRPIKIAIPRADDLHRPHGGGGTKIFPTSENFIEVLSRQISAIGQAFSATLNSPSPLPAVAQVNLRSDAVAKSHRPVAIFQPKTCPIIGVQDFGQLLVSVNASGLRELQREIRRKTKRVRAAVSTIASIEPFVGRNLVASCATDVNTSLKVRLVNHHSRNLNERVEAAFAALVKRLSNAEPQQLSYASRVRLFKVASGPTGAEELAATLAGFVGVQEVSPLPTYEVDTQAVYVGQATKESLPPPVPGADYPMVGLLDSGTDRDNPYLQAWVVERWEEDVPQDDQDNLHGSFIAGLLINARGLNHNDPRFPSGPCKILDAVVIPKRDGSPHPEDELLTSIRKVIARYHQRVKV